MDLLTILVLATGLSMDSFAVAISCGLAEQKVSFGHAVRISLAFAFFQGTLPLLGWAMGTGVKVYVEQIDHWIAFALLAYLGSKMILESLRQAHEKSVADIYSFRHIVTLSIATSIDALVVGFSYAMAESGKIFGGAVIIGAVTFFFSMLGIRIGKDVGNQFGSRVEFLGGLILIAIGIKILAEHLA
ncbi:MAG: manganese efflux pump MntP family protein [Marinilabiliales bacterium]|nr:manganese efflux pump MntP family protein [Marinilabiliales bacterium]